MAETPQGPIGHLAKTPQGQIGHLAKTPQGPIGHFLAIKEVRMSVNVWDVVLVACVVLAVALAIRSMRKTRCVGGCASCPCAEGCKTRKG
jgi:hypothetical protein